MNYVIIFSIMAFGNLKSSFILDILWWSLAAWLVGYVYLNGAGDWERFYLPATLNDYATAPLVANPSYVLFLFHPLSFLPVKLGGAMLAAINVACLYVCYRITTVNRWLILLSLPALIVISFGQLDGLVALGAVLGFLAIQNGSGVLLGTSILLLGLKPQVGGLLAVAYVFWAFSSLKRRPVLVALGIVAGVVLASFGAFGFWLVDWVIKIVDTSSSDGIEFVNVSSDIGLFPYGLAVLVLVLLFARRNIPALIVATVLSAPYACRLWPFHYLSWFTLPRGYRRRFLRCGECWSHR
jgi:hypothetical protein